MHSRLVNIAKGEWTIDQQRAILEGIDKTQRHVPHLDELFDTYVILKEDEPVGLVSVRPVNEVGAEVGVRLWKEGSFLYRMLAESLDGLFNHYDYVVVRVFTNNVRVKRLIQGAGFNLLDIEKMGGRSVEVHGVDRVTFRTIMLKRGLLYSYKREREDAEMEREAHEAYGIPTDREPWSVADSATERGT